jgi:hypothetical protein
MATKWCDEGETSVGNVYLKATTKPSYYLALYKTAEPAENGTVATLTEAQAPGTNGYARIALADADWTEQATKGVFKNLQKTFTAAGGGWGAIIGYFITTASTGTAGLLVCEEPFSDGPYTVNDGWSVKVTPQITIA